MKRSIQLLLLIVLSIVGQRNAIADTSNPFGFMKRLSYAPDSSRQGMSTSNIKTNVSLFVGQNYDNGYHSNSNNDENCLDSITKVREFFNTSTEKNKRWVQIQHLNDTVLNNVFSNQFLWPHQSKSNVCTMRIITKDLQVGDIETYQYQICGEPSGGSIGVEVCIRAGTVTVSVIPNQINLIDVLSVGGSMQHLSFIWEKPSNSFAEIENLAIVRNINDTIRYSTTNPGKLANGEIVADSILTSDSTFNINYVIRGGIAFYAIAGYNKAGELVALSNSMNPSYPLNNFSLVSPGDDKIEQTLNPEFKWQPSFQNNYQLWISTDSTFSNPTIITDIDTNFISIPTPLINNSTYYWKVFCTDSIPSNEQSWRFHCSLDPNSPNSFSLTEPIDNALLETEFPLLKWDYPDNLIDSLYFQVILSNDQSLSDTLVNEFTRHNFLSLLNYADLPKQTFIYWKVIAINKDGNFAQSNSINKFKIIANTLPEKFALFEPNIPNPNWSLTSSPYPTFIWQRSVDLDVLDVVSYTLYYSKFKNFSSYDSITSITDTTYSITIPLDENSLYFWKVKAYDQHGGFNFNYGLPNCFYVDMDDMPPSSFTITRKFNPSQNLPFGNYNLEPTIPVDDLFDYHHFFTEVSSDSAFTNPYIQMGAILCNNGCYPQGDYYVRMKCRSKRMDNTMPLGCSETTGESYTNTIFVPLGDSIWITNCRIMEPYSSTPLIIEASIKYPLMWDYYNSEFVNIEISYNGGSSWEIYDTLVPSNLGIYHYNNQGSYYGYYIRIPDSTSNLQIRITDSECASAYDVLDFNAEVILPLNKELIVLSPTSETSWKATTNQSIGYQSIKVDAFKIEYSLDNGMTWGLVCDSTRAPSFTWRVPDILEDLDSCLIKVTDYYYPSLTALSNKFSIRLCKRIYITENGNDLSGNGSKSFPYKTLTMAINNCESYDSIKIAEGTYQEKITSNSNYTFDCLIIRGGYDIDTWELDSNSVTTFINPNDTIMHFMHNVFYTMIDRVNFENAHVCIDNWRGTELTNSKISNCEKAICLTNKTSYIKVNQSKISNCRIGIYAQNYRRSIWVYNSIFSNIELFAIWAGDNYLCWNYYIYNTFINNTFINCQNSIYINAQTSDYWCIVYNGDTDYRDWITIKNNIFLGGEKGISISKVTWENILISNNLFYNLSSDHYTINDTIGHFYDNTNFNDIDPLFEDFAQENYKLLDYSPGIGAGTQTNNNIDFNNNIRPNPPGSNPDLGIYESELSLPNSILNEVNFGTTVFINETAANTFRISNSGTSVLTINETDVEITGADAASFSIVYPDDHTWPIALSTGQSFTFDLRFNPTEARAYRASLNIQDTINSKHSIALLGSGYDATLQPGFLFDFSGTWPPLNWRKFKGLPGTEPILPTTDTKWVHDQFGNNPNLTEPNSAKINFYSSARRHWLMSPPINLGDGSQGYELRFDLALTFHNTTNSVMLSPEQKFAVIISTDGGLTWSMDNILQWWNDTTPISNTGDRVILDLSAYSGRIMLGFYAEMTVSSDNTDYDLFVTNIAVSEPVEIEYPEPRNLTASDADMAAQLSWIEPLLNPATIAGFGEDYSNASHNNMNQPTVDLTEVGSLENPELPKGSKSHAGRGVLYDNGPFINSSGTGPDGADQSILQNTSLGMSTLGLGIQFASGNRVADDFVVNQTITVEAITVFAYQTGSTTTSTMTVGYVQIWDGDPTAGGQVIWGDVVTNRMTSTAWTNSYRLSEATPGTTRPIMRIVMATPELVLEPGIYWIDYTLEGSLASGPWAPPITINGQAITGNARKFVGITQSWEDFLDASTGTSQGLPYIIEGYTGSGGTVNGELLGYKIYRNGTLIGNTTTDVLTYLDSPLDAETYTYGVSAVYGQPYPGESAMATANVTIEQSSITVLPSSQIVSASGGSISFFVSSNTSWEVTKNVSWLTANPLSGINDATLIVDYDANTTAAVRTGQIIVSARIGSSQVSVTIIQPPACLPGWEPTSNLQYNMQVVAQILIDGQVSLNPNDILGAFVGEECRGIASPLPDNNGLVFLTVSSNVASGEQVELKIWNSNECNECNAIPGFEFVNQAEIGTFLQPYQFRCGAIQDITFGQGYTWFSLNVNPGSVSPNNLFTTLTPCYDDRVIGQTSFALYTGSNWIGSLSTLSMDKMYRMKLCSAQNLNLMGDAAPINPINLAVGYTWLGFVPQECKSVSEALSQLNPSPSYDDRVIGQNSFALYTGTQWIGTLTTMCPGAGYVIRLANSSILNWPAEDLAPIAAFTADTTEGIAPMLVNFTDQSSNNPTSWNWDFGDGTTSNLQNPSKIYFNDGSYNVTLTVTNEFGINTLTKSDFIFVADFPVTGLLAYYPFNGNADDISGNGNHGTVDGAVLNTDRFGNENSAYFFDGSNDKITTSFKPTNVNSISIWFNAQMSQPFNSGLFSTYLQNNFNGYYIGFQYSDAKGAFYYDGNLGTLIDFPAWDQWIHLVICSDGNNITVYVNGNQFITFSGKTTHAGNLYIGDSKADNRYFKGKIDDIRIYNYPLTINEVQTLYHEGDW